MNLFWLDGRSWIGITSPSNFRDGLNVYWDPVAQDDSEPRGFVHRRNRPRTLSADFAPPRFAWVVAVWSGPWPPPPAVAVSLPYRLLAVVTGTLPAARVIARLRRRRGVGAGPLPLLRLRPPRHARAVPGMR